MAYSKVWKSCQDYAVGIRNVNQLADNTAQIRTDLFVRHSDDFDSGDLPWQEWQGQHEDLKIPRAALAIEVTTYRVHGATSGANVRPGVATPYALYGAPVRAAAGEYLLPIHPSASGAIHFAIATPAATASSQVRRCVARWPSQAAGASSDAIYVVCYELSAGDFVQADYGFSLVVHATV